VAIFFGSPSRTHGCYGDSLLFSSPRTPQRTRVEDLHITAWAERHFLTLKTSWNERPARFAYVSSEARECFQVSIDAPVDGYTSIWARSQREGTMSYDFNVLEKAAKELVLSGRPHDAVKIYLFMADGDQSLDGGYLGEKLGGCYEMVGDLHAAKYWYGRAVDENPKALPKASRRAIGLQPSPSVDSSGDIIHN
jgi:hypothetical protein